MSALMVPKCVLRLPQRKESGVKLLATHESNCDVTSNVSAITRISLSGRVDAPALMELFSLHPTTTIASSKSMVISDLFLVHILGRGHDGIARVDCQTHKIFICDWQTCYAAYMTLENAATNDFFSKLAIKWGVKLFVIQ